MKCPHAPPALGLREAVLEQIANDQTDRLPHALADAVKALSAWVPTPPLDVTVMSAKVLVTVLAVPRLRQGRIPASPLT